MKEIRENAVERYLVRRVKELGGKTRKAKWVGRRGCPDRRVMLKRCFWVEVKRPGEELEDHQEREIAIMLSHGEDVFVVHNFEEVDIVLKTMCEEVYVVWGDLVL